MKWRGRLPPAAWGFSFEKALPAAALDVLAQLVDIFIRPFRVRLHDDVDKGVNLVDGHVYEQLVPVRVPFDRK